MDSLIKLAELILHNSKAKGRKGKSNHLDKSESKLYTMFYLYTKLNLYSPTKEHILRGLYIDRFMEFKRIEEAIDTWHEHHPRREVKWKRKKKW